MMFAIDRFILFPTRHTVPNVADENRVVELPVGESVLKLDVWIHRRPARGVASGKIRMVHFIGNASRAEFESPLLMGHFPDDLEIEAWVMNPPGFGRSQGEAKLRWLAPAGRAVFDAAAALGAPVFVSGTSLGSTIALHIAAEREVAGVLLANPPPLQAMILGMHGWWNMWALAVPVASQVPPEIDSLSNGPRALAPAVIVMAEKDEIVPPSYQAKVADAYGGDKRIIVLPGSRHNDPIPKRADQELSEALAWLARR